MSKKLRVAGRIILLFSAANLIMVWVDGISSWSIFPEPPPGYLATPGFLLISAVVAAIAAGVCHSIAGDIDKGARGEIDPPYDGMP